MLLRKAIAIDFDGCLFEAAWPAVGKPHLDVIQAAIREKQNGAALILWTCRSGQPLAEAVEACRKYGLEFDAVNANLPERVQAYGVDCRKVEADEYWDDRAVTMPIAIRAAHYWEETARQQQEQYDREEEKRRMTCGVKTAFTII